MRAGKGGAGNYGKGGGKGKGGAGKYGKGPPPPEAPQAGLTAGASEAGLTARGARGKGRGGSRTGVALEHKGRPSAAWTVPGETWKARFRAQAYISREDFDRIFGEAKEPGRPEGRVGR